MRFFDGAVSDDDSDDSDCGSAGGVSVDVGSVVAALSSAMVQALSVKILRFDRMNCLSAGPILSRRKPDWYRTAAHHSRYRMQWQGEARQDLSRVEYRGFRRHRPPLDSCGLNVSEYNGSAAFGAGEIPGRNGTTRDPLWRPHRQVIGARCVF